jgi:uncharacterized phage protein (TIGR01671 family)
MREIKFRAWSPFEESMSYDVTLYANGWMKCIFLNGYEAKYAGQDIIPLMQYTGLKDNNGKEIYEGDIVADHIGIGFVEYKNSAYRVNYGNGECKWFIDYLDSEGKTVEIIGNKHENPELLEVQS